MTKSSLELAVPALLCIGCGAGRPEAGGEQLVGGEAVAVLGAKSIEHADRNDGQVLPVASVGARLELSVQRVRLSYCRSLSAYAGLLIAGTRDGAIRRFYDEDGWKLISATRSEPCGLDVGESRVFWTESGTAVNRFQDGRVMSAAFDGTDLREIAVGQHGVTSLVIGSHGAYWFENDEGTLWRASQDGGSEMIAKVEPNQGRYAHGQRAEGMVSSDGYIVWAYTEGKSGVLNVAYAAEDGGDSGILAAFPNHHANPYGLALREGVAHFYVWELTEDSPGGRILSKEIGGDELETLWTGSAAFLAGTGGGLVWGTTSGELYTARHGGRPRKERASWVFPGPSGFAADDGELSWIDRRGALQRIRWGGTERKE